MLRFHIDRASVNVRDIVAGMPVETVGTPDAADLVWMRRAYRGWYARLKPWQALNHIPNEGVMTRKADLAGALHAHDPVAAIDGFSLRDFYPPTYRLDDPAERARFLAELPVEDSPQRPWILKPSTLSRGIGIRVGWQMTRLRRSLAAGRSVRFLHEGASVPCIIQRYIPDLLLLEGRKSELRIYWLIASLDPLLVLMYRQGTVRLTSREFKLGDFDDPLIHITNTYQQKRHGGVGPDTVLKWDFPHLQAYLTREKATPADHVESVLVPRLGRVLERVVHACIGELRQLPAAGHFFGLYGADVILDDALNPWLTEIQKGPGLSYDDAVKQTVIPPMLRGSLEFQMQVLRAKRAGRPLSDLPVPPGFLRVIGA